MRTISYDNHHRFVKMGAKAWLIPTHSTCTQARNSLRNADLAGTRTNLAFRALTDWATLPGGRLIRQIGPAPWPGDINRSGPCKIKRVCALNIRGASVRKFDNTDATRDFVQLMTEY